MGRTYILTFYSLTTLFQMLQWQLNEDNSLVPMSHHDFQMSLQWWELDEDSLASKGFLEMFSW